MHHSGLLLVAFVLACAAAPAPQPAKHCFPRNHQQGYHQASQGAAAALPSAQSPAAYPSTRGPATSPAASAPASAPASYPASAPASSPATAEARNGQTGRAHPAAGPSHQAMRVPPSRGKPHVLQPMPIPRQSFTPQTVVRAAYYTATSGAPAQKAANGASGKPAQQPQTNAVVAHCNLNATRPMVNLANFEQITNVQCQGTEQVTVQFSSEQAATQALQAWTVTAPSGGKTTVNVAGAAQGTTLMVGHNWSCGGAKTTTFLEIVGAGQQQQQNNQTAQPAAGGRQGSVLTLRTRAVKKEQVIRNFDIKFDHFTGTHGAGSARGAPGAPLKGTPVSGDSLPGMSKLHRRFFGVPSDRSIQVSLDANYDPVTRRAARPITLINVPGVASVVCSDCYTTGEAAMSASFAGDLLGLHSYKFEVRGKLLANWKVDASVQVPGANMGLAQEIAALSFPTSIVPGIAEFTPFVKLAGSYAYGQGSQDSKAVPLTAGYSIDFEFDWSLESDPVGGVWSLPRFSRNTAQPRVNPRAPRMVDGSVGARANATLSDELGVALKLFGNEALVANLATQHELGMELAVAADNGAACRGPAEEGKAAGTEQAGTSARLALTADTAIKYSAAIFGQPITHTGKPVELWRLGARALACPGGACNVCAAGSPSASATPQNSNPAAISDRSAAGTDAVATGRSESGNNGASTAAAVPQAQVFQNSPFPPPQQQQQAPAQASPATSADSQSQGYHKEYDLSDLWTGFKSLWS